jgi:hypothetical protein
VSYVLQTRQGSVYFTPKEIVFQFVIPQNGGTGQADSFPPAPQKKGRSLEENLRVQFLGARRDVKVQALAESPARFSYFRGSDPEKWVSGARTYEKLLYPDLYPEIDLLVSGGAGKLKNEYIVRPGGNSADIALCYQGATGLKTNDRGQLEIAHTGGALIEDAPECYQVIDGRKVPVEAAYRIEDGHTARIEVGEYNREAKLVIDPVIYSTYLGGSGDDEIIGDFSTLGLWLWDSGVWTQLSASNPD